MNFLEKYLKAHKKELEIQDVNPEMWLNIENHMLKTKNRSNRFYIWALSAAASILLILWIPTLFTKTSDPITREAIAAYYDLESMPQLVSFKTEELSKALFPTEHKEDFKILINQLEFLDNQYLEILKYIETNGYQEYIGKQLTDYYETKIELLNKIQSEIEKINKYENSIEPKTTFRDLIY